MKKILLFMTFAACATGVFAQDRLERLLEDVERNNRTLAALRNLRDAQVIEARVGNSLENPEVEFAHLWGKPGDLGKTGEVEVMQAFDFPTLYAVRNRLARIQQEKYGYEYAAARQQLLSDVQELFIEIAWLRERDAILSRMADNAREVVGVLEESFRAGDANILDVNGVKLAMIELDNAHKLNRIDLSAVEEELVGLNGGVALGSLPTTLPEDMPALPGFDKLQADYLELSPELLALLAGKRAADQDVKVSRGGSLPKLALGYKHEFSPGEKFNGVIVGMSIPMFGNRNNVKRARAQSLYAETQIESAKVDMMSSLRQSYARAKTMLATIVRYDQFIDRKNAERMLAKALDEGQISVVEYYDQLSPVYQSVLTQMELRCDYLKSYLGLNAIYL